MADKRNVEKEAKLKAKYTPKSTSSNERFKRENRPLFDEMLSARKRLDKALIAMEKEYDLVVALTDRNAVTGRRGNYYVIDHLRFYKEELLFTPCRAVRNAVPAAKPQSKQQPQQQPQQSQQPPRKMLQMVVEELNIKPEEYTNMVNKTLEEAKQS